MTLPASVLAARPYDDFDGGDNIRAITIDDGIKELAASLAAHGILQPVGGIDHGKSIESIFGFRRLAAYGWGLSQGLSLPSLIPVQLYPPTLSRSERRIIAATENLQRADLTGLEIYRLCKELLELNPDWQRQHLAAHLNKSAAAITQYLSPDRLIPEALQAFLDDRLSCNAAYEIARSPDQKAALDHYLSGGTREENRRQRAGKGQPHARPANRLTRLTIPLARDAATGQTGIDPEATDLAAAEAILKDALKAARQPRLKVARADDGITISLTAQDATVTLLEETLAAVRAASTLRTTIA